jgi:hypothetical protein
MARGSLVDFEEEEGCGLGRREFGCVEVEDVVLDLVAERSVAEARFDVEDAVGDAHVEEQLV